MKYVLAFFLLGFAFMILDSAWLHYRDNRKRRNNRQRQFTDKQLRRMLK